MIIIIMSLVKLSLGFFSDEPRFGNTKGPNASIGRYNMPLPWNENVLMKLKEIDFDLNQIRQCWLEADDGRFM